MAIKYEWKITSLKKTASQDGLSDVITGINFEYTGTKGTGKNKKSATFRGACPLPSPDKKAFVKLKDITESKAIEWAQANHPTTHMNEVIENRIAQMEKTINIGLSGSDLPWVEDDGSEKGAE